MKHKSLHTVTALTLGLTLLLTLLLVWGPRTVLAEDQPDGSIIITPQTTDGTWGPDVLSGRYVRDGESVTVEMEARPGTLSFDISFTLISDGREITYEKNSVILTDGASLVLTAR